MKLTATQVKAIKEPGRYGDGLGLYLSVAPGGSKNWVQRISIDGKRRDLGLGGYPTVSLAEARENARENRAAVVKGRNPLTEKSAPQRTIPTFAEAARATHATLRGKWRSEEHSNGWLRTLSSHVFPVIGDRPVNEINRVDILDILVPLYGSKAETARRLRQRIRSTFKWALSYDYVDENPAGEKLDAALPAVSHQKTHWRALPYAELPDALATIKVGHFSIAAKLALEFLTLTAARSGEVRRATWTEIDWERHLWIIPASRMKGGVEHRVPLSDSAMHVLRQAMALREPGEFIFPSPMKAGKGLSDMTMTKILRSAGLAEKMTVHGIRSTFRDWVAEQTPTPWAVAELALAHKVGSTVEQAYHRTDLLDQRRKLMDAWAEFLTQTSPE